MRRRNTYRRQCRWRVAQSDCFLDEIRSIRPAVPVVASMTPNAFLAEVLRALLRMRTELNDARATIYLPKKQVVTCKIASVLAKRQVNERQPTSTALFGFDKPPFPPARCGV